MGHLLGVPDPTPDDGVFTSLRISRIAAQALSSASPLVSAASSCSLYSMLVIHGDLRNPNHGSEI